MFRLDAEKKDGHTQLLPENLYQQLCSALHCSNASPHVDNFPQADHVILCYTILTESVSVAGQDQHYHHCVVR